MTNIKWWQVKNQNLAVATRKAGFDLAIYDQYSKSAQKELRKKSISESVEMLKDGFHEESKKKLSELKKGVYAICVSSPFTINYELKKSNIIYIGQGNVLGRLKTHFERSLFDFMQSLSGANFDFYIAEPRRRNSPNFYRHVEFLLLQEFAEKIRGGNRKFPLLNSNACSDQRIDDAGTDWKKPLETRGRRPRWILEPSKMDQFKRLD